MNFYIGWSHSDALFLDYYPNCPILVSAVPDNRGALKKFKQQPQKIIIDCGSVYYVKQRDRPRLKDIFELQCRFLNDISSEADIQMVHFDEPMLQKNTLSERYMAMERTLFNAYEYINVFHLKNIKDNIKPMGVIQGFDKASIEFSAYELKKMGYQRFGIGSLLFKHYVQQIRMIKYAVDIVGADNLHVFGVTGIPQIKAMVELGIRSFDSTRPTMAAAYFQIFYSRPFRTYFLSESRAKLSNSNRLSEPLPCNCPICKVNAKDLLIPTPRSYMKYRSIHNYYHLYTAFYDILKKKRGNDNHALSDVLWSGN